MRKCAFTIGEQQVCGCRFALNAEWLLPAHMASNLEHQGISPLHLAHGLPAFHIHT